MAAKNYTEILALVNAGNQMGLSNTIKRDYGIPLDFTSVQPSYDEAVKYAAENTKAYVGQPLSVGGKLYIINDVAAEAKYVIGEKEYDNYLVEVGSATEGDGVTIDLEEGVLTLHGFESALTGYLPRKAEDGSLEWVPISAVVQGDGNKVTTLTSEDGSVTITKKTDTDESLVYDLSVAAYDDSAVYEAIAKALQDAKDYADDNDADTVYDDTALQARVKTIEDDYLKTADKYDDTALAARVKALEDEERYDETPLANRVEALETAVGDAESGLIKDLADTSAALEALEGTVNAFLTGEGTDAALDSLKELIAYIDEHDGADLTEMIATIERIEGKLSGIDTTVVAYVTAAIDALKIGDYAKAADLATLAGRVDALEAKPFDTYATKSEVEAVDGKFADYYTKTEVDNKGYAVAETVAETYATKQSVTDLGNSIAATLNSYAKTEDVNKELAKKIETASIAHTSTDKAEGVTVNGTNLDIVVDAFTKQEVRDYVADAIQTMTGGESAADVKLLLENHIAAYTEKVGQIDAKDAAQDTAITEAKAQADKGVADAAAAQATANAAAAQAETNKTDIAGHLARIGVLETAKSAHETRISALEGVVGHAANADEGIEASGLVKAVADNAALLGTVQGQISTLTTEDGRLAGLISANAEEIAKKANADAVYTKGEADKAIEDAIKAIPAIDFTPYATVVYVDGKFATIDALNGVAGDLAEEIARATAAEKKIADDLALLIENPTEDLDSVKELIEHVKNNGAAVTGIISRLDGHDTAIAGLDERLTAVEAKPDYVLPAATLETLGGVKLSTEIGTNEAGQMEIKGVSTDKLVQGVDELVLCGGNANGAASV